MQIQIHATVEAANGLYEKIREKVGKLNTYYDRIERADIYLLEGDGKVNGAKIVEIRLAVPKNDIFIKVESTTFNKAVTEATNKLRRQLIKHKKKITTRR